MVGTGFQEANDSTINADTNVFRPRLDRIQSVRGLYLRSFSALAVSKWNCDVNDGCGLFRSFFKDNVCMDVGSLAGSKEVV